MKFSTTFLTCLLATSSVFSYSIEKRDDMEKQMEQMKQEMEKMQGQIQDKVQSEMGKIPNDSSISNNFNLTNSSAPASDSSISENFNQVNPSGNSNSNPFGDLKNNQDSDIFNKECEKVVQEYYSCFPKRMTGENYDECCDVYNSEKCVTLFKKKLSENEACKKGVEMLENQILYMAGVMDISCAKDHDKYCPISKLNKEGVSSKKTTPITQSVIDETCKSAICLDKAINGLEASKKMAEKMADTQNAIAQAFGNMQKRATTEDAKKVLDGYITQLKSDKCQSQAVANGAIQLKIGNLLVLTLGLFLYYLL